MDFFLGAPNPAWLARLSIPLFISVARILKRKRFPHALGPWGLDSAGFTQLSKYGRWLISAVRYAAIARRAAVEIGMPALVSIQDWMCEPPVRALTGKSVAEHQKRTIASYFELAHMAPWLPWMPVLQGWHLEEYLSHVEQYRAAGVDLRRFDRVGVGSICRRQGRREAAAIINAVAARGIRIHAFGVKIDGLRLFADRVVSADSMAWSFAARQEKKLLPECAAENLHKPKSKQHINCANCIRWAVQWYEEKIVPLLPPAPTQESHGDF